MKPIVCCLAAGLVLASSGHTSALDEKIELQVLSYRALDEYSIADILRSARAKHLHGFEVQGLTAISPTPDGNVRVAVCYWLGDVQHIDPEATCGIHFILGDNGKLLADPETANLSNALLAGYNAFELALDINYGTVCGTADKRDDRKC